MTSFPQVFRRSAFSSYDPAITRVYTSTPHSIHHHADFGLKYPVRAQRSTPRHIKVSRLDLGRLLGSDWVSAEKEAQFIKTYGSGRVPWRSSNEITRPRRGDTLGELYDEEFPAPEEGKVELMDDVNTMSPVEFTQYLARVRKHRKEYLVGKLQHLSPRTAEKLVLPEDKTLVNLAQKGHVANPDTASFQIGLTKAQLDDVSSKKLNSAPHVLHGLSYSRLKPTASNYTGVLTHRGRALDRARGNNARGGSRGGFGGSREGTNNAWIVSYGGLTGVSSTTGGTISDGAHIKEGVDYTRSKPDQGVSNFRIASAKLSHPPKVINLRQNAELSKWDTTRRARPNRSSPLDTFRFDIQLENVPDDHLRLINKVGTVAWSAHDGRSSAGVLNDWSDKHGIGGPRQNRKLGEGLRSVRAMQDRQNRVQAGKENHSNILAILSRLAKKSEPK